jgi:hypothetical protein
LISEEGFHNMTVSVAIHVFPEMELLDFAGPYAVFTTANRVHKRLAPETPDVFHIFTVARGLSLVRAYNVWVRPSSDLYNPLAFSSVSQKGTSCRF